MQRRVVVKQCASVVTDAERRQLVDEAKTMKRLAIDPHENVMRVCFIGFLVSAISTAYILLVCACARVHLCVVHAYERKRAH